ncbi:hypothetical protein G3I59_27335 [Amycolatopsis rubida]|uniref:Uncharacterized protein n=1 Tax=Amycolatopsis rubida TaxID=112413 RepID=A0ABX0C2C6_9PSEU|nr:MULTISPECIES: hypothetical protein [Amycolatopsis]MYW94211.1 hypothetical protein [Amycolatopsis rubida]NEC59200.1 hypothetical protein [Amycolatopsis rubida]OAP20856.1 hypothetical protein A4R44_08301 [Amycolatopsis sp. M39]
MVTAIRHKDFGRVAQVLATLAAGTPTTQSSVVRDVVHLCAVAVSGPFCPQPAGTVFTAVAFGETARPAEVDDLDPGVRAVLAGLNGDWAGLDCQVGLAVRGDGLSAIVRCLLWTVEFGTG